MTYSESLAALWPALVAARRGFGALTKDAAAQIGAGRSYRYSSLGQLLDVAMPSLLEHELIIVQAVDSDDGAALVLRTRLTHAPSGEYLETRIPLPAVDSPQAAGSQLTYFRRYSLLALLSVAPVDDDDGAAATAAPARPPAAEAPPASRPRRTRGSSPPPERPSPPPGSPVPGSTPASAAAQPYGTSDVAVAVVEDHPAKDGSALHWVRDVEDHAYYTRDGILAARLAALAGSGQLVRLAWKAELVGDRIVRQLRGVSPAVDDAPF